jgi:hypothetical protein
MSIQWLDMPPWPYAAFSPPPETQHHQHPKYPAFNYYLSTQPPRIAVRQCCWRRYSEITNSLESWKGNMMSQSDFMEHDTVLILSNDDEVIGVHLRKSLNNSYRKIHGEFCIMPSAYFYMMHRLRSFCCSSVRVTRLHFRMCGRILAVHINWMGWIWMKLIHKRMWRMVLWVEQIR